VAAALASDAPPEELRELHRRLRDTDRVAVIWSEDDPTGGRHLAALAAALGLAEGSGAYCLPRTPGGRGVAGAWRAAGDGRGEEPSEGDIGALIVSGDEALYDARVLDLAERARFVLTTSMFMNDVTGQSHLVLPGTGYLERDGTTVNLEGRSQRLRRAVQPPGWDELEFFARLAQRFGVDVDPWARATAAEQAPLPPRGAAVPVERLPLHAQASAPTTGFQVLRYRPLFSGAAVARVPQLQFQRPAPEIELPHADAREQGIANGDRVTVSSNGTSCELVARLNRRLRPGVARLATDHAHSLGEVVEIAKVSA
jgi:anaerobic selenocysteine-containing dehydrogenase